MAEDKHGTIASVKAIAVAIGNQIATLSDLGKDKTNWHGECMFLLTRPGTDNEHISIVLTKRDMQHLRDMFDEMLQDIE